MSHALFSLDIKVLLNDEKDSQELGESTRKKHKSDSNKKLQFQGPFTDKETTQKLNYSTTPPSSSFQPDTLKFAIQNYTGTVFLYVPYSNDPLSIKENSIKCPVPNCSHQITTRSSKPPIKRKRFKGSLRYHLAFHHCLEQLNKHGLLPRTTGICPKCNQQFKSDPGLRNHIVMTHINFTNDQQKATKKN